MRWRVVAIGVLVGLLVGLLMLRLLENKLIYFPEPWPDSFDPGTVAAGPVEEIELFVDGVTIHGWFLPASGDWTLVYLHGNAGNLTSRLGWLKRLADEVPVNVLAIDYRGYGRSSGSPDEEGLAADARAAYDAARARGAARIVCYGHSLGGAVAARLANERNCDALILSSTFTSIPDMAARQLPFVPRAFVGTQWDTLAVLPKLSVPILILHSRQDDLIPYTMAERNHAAAVEPKRLVLYEGAGHNEVVFQHGDAIIAEIRRALRAPRRRSAEQ